MKKTLRKILSLICIIAILFSISIPAYAVVGSGKLDLDIDTTNHQALTMSVDSVASTSSLQAFCIGWTFTFSNSKGSVSVYVPISQIDTDGGSRIYTFPMTTGWTKEFTGIAGGKSIRDLVSNKTTYDKIITSGCTVHADARIRKYSYSGGKYTPLNTYANSKADIDNNFSEFSSTFRTNTKADYFDLSLTLDPEPPDPSIPKPTPTVTLTAPKDGDTYYVGASIPFTGTGTNCDHIAGYINGNYVSVQQGNAYNSNYTASQVGKVTFQVIGRNTANADDPGSKTASSQIATVNVIDKPINVYTVFVHHVTKNDDGSIKRIAPDKTFYIQQQDGQKVVIAVNGKILTADDKIIYTCPEFEGYVFKYSEQTTEEKPISD